MQQTNVGNVYKGALSILLNIPFHPFIVNCYRHLQGGYILQMTKIMLEHLGSIRKLARQLDMILQLILMTKKTITNEIKKVLELWIIATPKEEMKVIRQILNQSTNLKTPLHSSQMTFNALSVVDMTTSLISAQILNARNVDNKIQDTTRSSVYSRKIDHTQNLLLLKDKPTEPTMTFLLSFPTNPSPPLLLASLPPDEDSWYVFSPRPKKTDKLAPILEEIVRTTYYSEEDSPLPDKSTIQSPLLVAPQSPHSPQQNLDTTITDTGRNKTTLTMTRTTTMISTTSPGVTSWKTPLDIRINEDIDPSKGDYVTETLDSTELLMEDQTWLDYLWDFETRGINLDLSSDTD